MKSCYAGNEDFDWEAKEHEHSKRLKLQVREQSSYCEERLEAHGDVLVADVQIFVPILVAVELAGIAALVVVAMCLHWPCLRLIWSWVTPSHLQHEQCW